jgi:small GTP-binding protein
MEEREELEQLRQSLDMIKSIMSAKDDSSQQNNVEQAKRVREFICFFAENLYKECFEYIKERKDKGPFLTIPEKTILSELNIDEWVTELKDEVKKWFVLEQKTWLKNKTAVAFVGGFSSGKTSIVNKLLGEEHQMPVDRRATTAVATYVSYSDVGMVKFADFEYAVKCLEDKDVLKKFTKFNDAIKDFPTSKLLRNFIVEEDNAKLLKLRNFSILDTPGFENDDEDTKRAIEVINETDAVFWVVDINDGDIKASSRNIIENNLNNVPLYIVINKTDLKSPSEREDVIKKIRDTVKKMKNIKFSDDISFSKKEPIEKIIDIMEKIERKSSGEFFKIIEDNITLIISMLQRYVNHLNEELRKKRRKIDEIETKIREENQETGRLVKLLDDATQKLGSMNSMYQNFWNIYNGRVKNENLWAQSLRNVGNFRLELAEACDEKSDIESYKKITELLLNRCNECLRQLKGLIEPFAN